MIRIIFSRTGSESVFRWKSLIFYAYKMIMMDKFSTNCSLEKAPTVHIRRKNLRLGGC